MHDRLNASIWLIDFAKTIGLPEKVVIDHNSAWTVGNHEDGYLIGINNLIDIFTDLLLQSNSAKDADSSVEAEDIDTDELSSPSSRLSLESKPDTESPAIANSRGSITTPSIVKTNSTQQIIILDNRDIESQGGT